MKKLFYLIFPFFLFASCDKIDSWLGVDEEDDPNEQPKPQPVVDPDISQGLMAYYKFEGNYEDATENKIHGNGINKPEFVEGLVSGTQALKLNRMRNTQVIIPDGLIDSPDMSVSFWGKNFDDGSIFFASQNSNPCYSLHMKEGRLRFINGLGNHLYHLDEMLFYKHPDITDGLWHHIVLTKKQQEYKDELKLYIDGQFVDIVTSDNRDDDAIKFVIGGKNEFLKIDGNNMVIDNLRIYDTRTLSSKRVQEIYKKKL